MHKILTLVLLAVVAMSLAGCHHVFGMMMGKMLYDDGYHGGHRGGWAPNDDWSPRGQFDDSQWHKEDYEDVAGGHMIASAKLTAHFVAAAIAAGMTTDEINAVLAEVADESAITEFWVTDAEGNVVYTNNAEIQFQFPTDPNAGTQAAPFAHLLTGDETVVVQDMQPRESDGRMFRYVGVAGVDEARIVQVGIEGEDYWDK